MTHGPVAQMVVYEHLEQGVKKKRKHVTIFNVPGGDILVKKGLHDDRLPTMSFEKLVTLRDRYPEFIAKVEEELEKAKAEVLTPGRRVADISNEISPEQVSLTVNLVVNINM